MIDGDLAEWAVSTEVISLASTPGTSGADPVQASLTWDREALYAGFRVIDDDLVTSGSGDRIADPFAVDRIEIRVDVDGDGGVLGLDDVRVLVGCDGSMAVYRGTRPTADDRTVMAGVGPVAGLGAAVARQDDRYTAEVALPFSLLGVDAPSSGTSLALDLGYTDLAPVPGSVANREPNRGTWSDAHGGTWPRITLTGRPPLGERLGIAASPTVLALAVGFLVAIAAAAALWRRQRRERSRFEALAARLDEIERTSAPSLELALVDPGASPTASLTVAPPATASISLDASASLVAVLRTGFTILPFEQAAKDLASRIDDLDSRSDTSVGASEWNALAEMAVAYLKAHMADNVAVGELAKALHTTPRTLQRGIRRALEATPRELILAVRMTEAKRLLKTGVHRVSEVGYMVGFEDPAHFSRRFKAYFRCAPSEFVRSYRDAARGEGRS